ncbi:MAG: DHH family phosphoesterase [Andreesenia angusta]|nr:DHH family phosphoesterase [Andreesenia angusta]
MRNFIRVLIISYLILLPLVFHLLKLNYILTTIIFIVNMILLALILAYRTIEKRNHNRDRELKQILHIDNEVYNSPLPYIIIDNKGKIIWHNDSVKKITDVVKINQNYIFNIFPKFNIENLYTKDEYIYSNNGKYFKTIKENLNTKDLGNVIKLYMVDVSDREQILQNYSAKELTIGIIYIDNFEDIFGMESNIDQNKNLAEIDRYIYTLLNKLNGFAEKIDDYKYLIFFEKRYLEFLKRRRFDILDDIKKMDFGGKLPVTISIGVGSEGKNVKENYYNAKNAMDIALGRGGDQAVIKSNDKLSFYGGKTKAVEKRTKVKARVIAYALRSIIDQADKIFIMGHRSPDLDCFGAAIGMYRISKFRNKEAYIVMDRASSSIDLIYRKIRDNIEEYDMNIISSKDARKLVTENSICIVVDTHKYSHVESEDFLRKMEKKVVIDHHRMGSDVIDDTILSYIETYASSTCELITEIISYIAENLKMNKLEAEALLSGIALDTKHFSVKTGVRTFEAAAYLKRKGADTEMVSELFRNNMKDLKIKAEAIRESEMINDYVAIAKIEELTESANLIAAQTADELLNTKSAKATFVFSQLESGIHISARSVGEVDVQSVMEELGGGGHLNASGARLNTSMEEAVEKVKKLIYKHF